MGGVVIIIVLLVVAFWQYIVAAIVLAALIILIRRAVVAERKRALLEPKPAPKPVEVRVTPQAKPRAPDTPEIWRKWDGTRKWVVAQDKAAWDRDFREAEEWAELQAPATSEDVFARLRTRLGNLG